MMGFFYLVCLIAGYGDYHWPRGPTIAPIPRSQRPRIRCKIVDVFINWRNARWLHPP